MISSLQEFRDRMELVIRQLHSVIRTQDNLSRSSDETMRILKYALRRGLEDMDLEGNLKTPWGRIDVTLAFNLCRIYTTRDSAPILNYERILPHLFPRAAAEPAPRSAEEVPPDEMRRRENLVRQIFGDSFSKGFRLPSQQTIDRAHASAVSRRANTAAELAANPPARVDPFWNEPPQRQIDLLGMNGMVQTHRLAEDEAALGAAVYLQPDGTVSTRVPSRGPVVRLGFVQSMGQEPGTFNVYISQMNLGERPDPDPRERIEITQQLLANGMISSQAALQALGLSPDSDSFRNPTILPDDPPKTVEPVIVDPKRRIEP